jgi:hypothetical protein
MNPSRKFKTGLCVILILVSLLFILNAYAIPYDHIFTQYLGTGSVANAISPCRGVNPLDINNVGIFSKMNQARKVVDGTNPHQGIDFYMSSGTDVYPIISGVVDYIDYTNEYQQQHIVIKSTINNVDYYVTYMHIEPVGNLQVNDIVDVYDKIGDVASYVIYSPHLHITCQTNEGQNLYKTGLYQFFRTNASYNYGKDMDVITGGHFSGNTYYITAYFRSNGGTHPEGMPFHCKSLTVYYKIFHVRTQTEETHSITFETSIDPNSHVLTYPSNYDSSTYTYAIDFSQFIGADNYKVECGDTIQFYMAVVREGHGNDNDCDFNTVLGDGTMDYSIWPMYYERPDIGMTVTAPIIYGNSYTNTSTHEWPTEWTTATEPTCTTVGKESRSCNNCGATEERSLPLNSSNHLGGSHWEVVTNTTCTTSGSKNLVCNGCNAVLDTASIDETGHSMGSWYTVTVSACCTYGTERSDCSECDYYVESPLPFNSSNHSGGSHWETVTNPTCTTQGSKNLVCNGCSAVLDTASIPAPGHSMGSWYTVTASTCYTSGTQRRDCSECGCYEEGSLGVLSHSMSGWSVNEASTCCTLGTQSRYCNRPGCSYNVYDSLPLNPSNHSGGTYWTVTTAATCTASGIRSQICYGCDAVMSTQPISALGHNWGGWVYQYTYYDEDWQSNVNVYKRTCSRCGAVDYDYI